jgi:hypothetical protein
MSRLHAIVALALPLFVACASVAPEAMNASIVLAKTVERGKGASQISDAFTFEGAIYVFTALTWPPEQRGGTKVFEVRWFNGDRLVSKGTMPAVRLAGPPYYFWFSTSGVALGTGPCHVEVYVDGVLMGSRPFTVSQS